MPLSGVRSTELAISAARPGAYATKPHGTTIERNSDRFRILPWELLGGKPGAPSQFTVERGGVSIHLGSKVNFPLQRGDRLIIEIAGAGGYGDPRQP